jgi:hypothetical protein
MVQGMALTLWMLGTWMVFHFPYDSVVSSIWMICSPENCYGSLCPFFFQQFLFSTVKSALVIASVVADYPFFFCLL